jgi:hypothetical protein
LAIEVAVSQGCMTIEATEPTPVRKA